MTVTGWLMILGCIVINIITCYFFFTEEKIQTKGKNTQKLEIPKDRIIYVGTCLAINIGIALILVLYYKHTSIPFVLKRLSLLSLLWAVGYIDFKTYKIPNRFVVLGLLYRAVILILEVFMERELILTNLISEGVSVATLLLASILCSLCVKNAIGYGDLKLFVIMGLMLGFSNIWSAIFVSLIATFFVAGGLLLTHKKTRKDSIPFAPLLMVGTYVSLIITGM